MISFYGRGGDLEDPNTVANVTKSGTDVVVTKKDGSSSSFSFFRAVVSAT